MRPRILNIFGKKVKVHYVKGLTNQGAMGVYSQGSIYIDSSLKGHDLAQTILHEGFHAICDRLNIRLDEQVEEILADTTAVFVEENFDIKLKKKR
jgi:hypothetical protein